MSDTTLTAAARPAPIDRKAAARAAMLHAPILSTLLALAAPTIAVLLAQTAVNVAETYYIGYLGTTDLAGVALVFPVYMLMVTMSNGGLGSGVASAVARAIGAGRRHDADALVLHAVVLALGVGAIFTLATILSGPALYAVLGGRGEALTAALRYSDTIFAAAIAIWIVNLLASALRGSGNVRVPATVTLIGAIVMIPASPALIFGFGPIPRLGITGAGLALAIYNVGAMIVLLRYMTSGRGGLTLRRSRLEWRLFADILKVGIPTALNTVQTNLTVVLVTGAVGTFGVDAIAGYGIASRLDYVMIPILFGLSSAVLTMVGVNMGAGHVARARRIAWMSSAIGAGFAEIVGVTVALFPGLWTHLFSTAPQVLQPAATYLHIVAPLYGLMALGFVFSFAAQGAGHVLWPFLAVTARMIVAAGIGVIAVRAFGIGMPGLSLIVAASFALYAPLCTIAMIRKSVWKSPMQHG
ncbi:MATE family efflux transporter [Gluconacetobacter azotocaptans]|uniref:MATE family efflux transporter n=1 Tax=Gluconacetobacter azotocaptans TaxID=142834 RepID=UPI00195AEF44|nr:MATE family efflux transporter [Gluconacetobacter azotocaptans]MBM9400018.1 MATE family efflux transporter [Gluconacetobacter azotocaptans]